MASALACGAPRARKAHGITHTEPSLNQSIGSVSKPRPIFLVNRKWYIELTTIKIEQYKEDTK